MKLKVLLLCTVLILIAYVVWLFFHVTGPLGWLFFVVEGSISLLPLLFLINHWTQRHVHKSSYPPVGSVDVFITVVNEPLELFEPVLRSLSRITYENKKIYVLDDGGRSAVESLATQYGATYISRADRPAFYKAGNLNNGLLVSSGDFILVIDADQEVTNPYILDELLGHFIEDSKLSLVATRQSFVTPPEDFNHDILFYEHIQTGKNANNAAISCGSGVIYRRSSLDVIGGFPTWNMVEDLYTSYKLHCAGFKSLYVNKIYTKGTAPLDLADIYKQRGTWGLDTMRLFVKDNPLFKRSLSWRQKLHYSELAVTYAISAVCIPLLFLMPAISLLFGLQAVTDIYGYSAFRVPSLIMLLIFYYYVCGKTFVAGQFWAGLFPAYFKGLVFAIMPGKPSYKVTSKVSSGGRHLRQIIPHLVLVFFSFGSVLWYVASNGWDSIVLFTFVIQFLMVFWLYPIIIRGLFGVPKLRVEIEPEKLGAVATQRN